MTVTNLAASGVVVPESSCTLISGSRINFMCNFDRGIDDSIINGCNLPCREYPSGTIRTWFPVLTALVTG